MMKDRVLTEELVKMWMLVGLCAAVRLAMKGRDARLSHVGVDIGLTTPKSIQYFT